MTGVGGRGESRARALPEYGAVLVDLDGTLIDSSAPVRRAWAAFADRHGLGVEEVLHFASGRPSRETARELAPDADNALEARLLEDAEVSDTEGLIALPGAAALLAAAPPRGPLAALAIVTSCSRRLAEVRLRGAGLPVPEVMVCADDVCAGKPDPECYLLGARRLGVAPAECVVLEDAPAGVRAGRAAGMDVIALRTAHGDDELTAAGATVIVDDLGALL